MIVQVARIIERYVNGETEIPGYAVLRGPMGEEISSKFFFTLKILPDSFVIDPQPVMPITDQRLHSIPVYLYYYIDGGNCVFFTSDEKHSPVRHGSLGDVISGPHLFKID